MCPSAVQILKTILNIWTGSITAIWVFLCEERLENWGEKKNRKKKSCSERLEELDLFSFMKDYGRMMGLQYETTSPLENALCRRDLQSIEKRQKEKQSLEDVDKFSSDSD